MRPVDAVSDLEPTLAEVVPVELVAAGKAGIPVLDTSVSAKVPDQGGPPEPKDFVPRFDSVIRLGSGPNLNDTDIRFSERGDVVL